MADDAAIEDRFWKELKASPFVMLGLDGARDGHAQPMTAQYEGEHGPLYFFLNKDNSLIEALGTSHRAIATYTGKGHDLFATIHGNLSLETSEAVIDRLWSPQAAAWFEKGRDDPKLAVLRLDTERAEIWRNQSTLGAGIKRLFGADPKEEAKKNVAEVTL